MVDKRPAPIPKKMTRTTKVDPPITRYSFGTFEAA